MAPKIIDLRPSLRAARRQERADESRHRGLAPKRPAPLRTRRRRIRIFAALAILFVLALATYGIHYLSYRPSLRISDVAVRGVIAQDPEAVATYVKSQIGTESLRFFPRDSIFAYPKDELRAGILGNFPRLESVRIGRSSILSTTLIVNVDERAPYAIWCNDTTADITQCYVMDSQGFIFADAGPVPIKPDVAYSFSGGLAQADPIGSTFITGHFAGLQQLLRQMQDAGYTPLSVRIESEQDFSVLLVNGFSIKASLGQDVDTIVHNLELVTVSETIRGKEAQLEYIDLRFGNRVYYKFKGQAAPNTQ